jgi:tetratricopeptide (TPR) repeat protein
MNKSWLTIFFIGITTQGFGQNSQFLPQQGVPDASINIAVSSHDEHDGNAFFMEAEKNERKGELDEAITLFGKAAFEFNSSKLLDKYGSALLRLSNAHYLLAHYTEAEQVVLNVAIKNYSKLGSRRGLMDSYSQLGKIYLASTKYTQSLWFYTQQGILAKQAGNDRAYIESVLGIANVKIKKKDYVLASRDLTRAELLANASNLSQYKGQIKEARALIPAKKVAKKESK